MLQADFYWLILTIIPAVIEWSVLKLILKESSKLKTSKLISHLSFIVPIIIVTLMIVVDLNIFFKLFICMLLTFIIAKFNYQTTVLKAIFISLSYWALIVFIDVISSSIVVSLNQISNLDPLLDENMFRLQVIIIAKSILILLIPIIKSTKLKREITKREYIYLIIPMIANIASILVCIRYTFEGTPSDNTKFLLISIVSILFLLSNISLIFIITRVINLNHINFKNRLINEKVGMQSKHYQNLLKKSYFYNLQTEFETQNNFLDIILTEKKSICYVNDIKLLVNLDFTKCDFFELSDICSVFSNMIDYLIEKCEDMKGKNIPKRIKLSGKDINNFYVIKCECSKMLEVIDKNSTKESNVLESEELLNDLKINSIKKSVDKYSGELVIETSNENYSMTILLPLANIKVQD